MGELLENQFRIGLVRMERAIKEKMSVYQEMATAMPRRSSSCPMTSRDRSVKMLVGVMSALIRARVLWWRLAFQPAW